MFNMHVSKYFFTLQTVQLIGFSVALAISYLITPFIQSRALKLGVLDKPSKRKLHTTPIPRLGGVSIYTSLFLTSLIFVTAYLNYRTSTVGSFTLLGIFAGGTIIFFLGLLDDIESINPFIKLFVQIAAASVSWLLGVRIVQVANPLYHSNLLLFQISVGDQVIAFNTVLSYLLTVLWIVGITNAINLIDGMDGLATGISIISAIAIWAVAVDFRINQPAGALMAATLAGALLGFLRWNFNPARIFLGDSGAYLTGFILASLTVSCVVKKVTLVVMTPVLILIFALPILDTAFAIIRRLLRGKPILEPDKEHLHHRILAIGLSQKRASYILYFISGILGIWATCLISGKSFYRFMILSALIVGIALFYACIINWKHQKLLRNLFIKNNPDE